jgi:signal transduction histidine kinase
MLIRHWFRIVGPLLLFAAIGTTGVVLLLKTAAQSQAHSELLALAEADADYVREAVEAVNERSAEGILMKDNNNFNHQVQSFQNEFLKYHHTQLSGVKVQFQRATTLEPRLDTVTVPISSDTELTLIRAHPTMREVLEQPVSLGALMAFWAVWFGLAWAVTLPSLDAQRFGLLGSVAASLAHELRNPIAAIRLHGQLLEQKEPVNAGLIVLEATKIEDMLNQWMFLARPEPPQAADIVLGDLIAQVVRVLAPVAEHAGVKVEVKGSPGRCVRVDSHRLGQVFHNIMLNAIQAMPEGGILTITISEKDICFTDSGPGFSPQALRRAANTLYSEKEGGMGLGLNVARKIIRAHNGSLLLANLPAGGAAVRVVL